MNQESWDWAEGRGVEGSSGRGAEGPENQKAFENIKWPLLFYVLREYRMRPVVWCGLSKTQAKLKIFQTDRLWKKYWITTDSLET